MGGFVDEFQRAKKLLKNDPEGALKIVLEKHREVSDEFHRLQDLGKRFAYINNKLENVEAVLKEIKREGGTKSEILKRQRFNIEATIGWVDAELKIAKPTFAKVVKDMRKLAK